MTPKHHFVMPAGPAQQESSSGCQPHTPIAPIHSEGHRTIPSTTPVEKSEQDDTAEAVKDDTRAQVRRNQVQVLYCPFHLHATCQHTGPTFAPHTAAASNSQCPLRRRKIKAKGKNLLRLSQEPAMEQPACLEAQPASCQYRHTTPGDTLASCSAYFRPGKKCRFKN